MARYIDADKFDTYLRLHHFPSKIMYKGKTIYDYLKEYADKETVDVRENTHGEWKCNDLGGDTFLYRCSKCRFLADDLTKFCPNCGSFNGGEK